MDSRPSKLPCAWPTDGRSKLHNSDKGWRLTHPDRTPMLYNGEKWIDEPAREMAAAPEWQLFRPVASSSGLKKTRNSLIWRFKG